MGETETGQPIPKNVRNWLEQKIPNQTEDQIQTAHLTLIADQLTAVIAMKGIEIAFENTWEDIRTPLHEETGIWTTPSELRNAYETFELLNKTELTRYREQQLSTNP